MPSEREAHLERYRRNLQGEIDSCALYRALARYESRPELGELYRRLATIEERHAEFWRTQFRLLGASAPELAPSWRTRLLIRIARLLGPDWVIGAAASLEQIDRGQYDGQPEACDTGMPGQERSHARLLNELARGRRNTWNGRLFASLEGRHGAGGGNALRAAVLGANDGLISNFSLVMGVAGAAFAADALLLTGLAGLLAGACSMALGEWLSVQNARELYEQQIATERDELEMVPDEEAEELVLIYRAKGLDEGKARAMAEGIMADKGRALDTLVREELGVDPDDLGGSAWLAAITSFVVFSLGALIPVLPFLLLDGQAAVVACALFSAGGLFLIGALVTLFTGRGLLYSGLRQVAFGLGAAAITYGLGHWLGVTVGG
ncbi:VIT1/CCC1 transporter family protein [Pseudomonas sp. AN-1]|uniref:VIT1/CCC1 transporter family protein n=1 Tax=Pseudomonas sp. AN-1 TaxID=3096605 RepID=UPI002A69C783|nr:VIT1/CCC1 transporter family protein [Pseudomonas sp. AN-1]WPP45702.1 VIT1/CCC1 transporter family protein [Pseudomonas sp. AN-1]